MNEKNVFIVCLICFVLFTLSGCCTRATVYGNGNRADAVRDHIGELSERQTEAAIASEQLNGTLEGAREKSENLSGELTRSREQSEKLEQSITDGKGDIDSLAAILQRIRERGCRNNSETASDHH
ncbi:hypothetical protein [Treponema sp.]|uniref:hypothetical protein n=1 Tax=Treponema sp. TaxID=166 RepID=UPI003FA2FF5E